MQEVVAVAAVREDANEMQVSQPPAKELEAQLAVAQEMIRRLELVRLDQDYRIKELESQLKTEVSTSESVDSMQLEEPSVRTASTSSPFRGLLECDLPVEGPTDASPTAAPDEDLESHSGVETLSFDGSEAALSIPSTPDLPMRQPVYTCASERVPAGPPLPPGTYACGQSSVFYQVPAAADAPPCWEVHWYRVSYLGGVEVRTHPCVEAPRTGVLLPQNSIFPASELWPSEDGRTYLRLADGSGWLFDDMAHHPEDPTVIRLTNPELATPTVSLRATTTLSTAPLGTGETTPLATKPMADAARIEEAPASNRPSLQGTEWAEMEDESDCDGASSPDGAESTMEDATRSWILESADKQKRGKRGGAKRRKRGGVKHRPRAERDAIAAAMGR